MRIYRTSHVLLHGYLRNVTREESLGRPFSGEQRADRRPDAVVACLKAFAVVRACNLRPRAVRRLTATWASFSPERAIFHLLKLSQLKEAVNGGQGRRRFIVPTKRSSPHGEDKHRMDCTNGHLERPSCCLAEPSPVLRRAYPTNLVRLVSGAFGSDASH